MKILTVSDEESRALWDFYKPGRLNNYDLIISCGDLKPKYLSFLVTMAHCPLLYVHGNHDGNYTFERPEGCDCIDDQLVVYNGVRILGLGGCRKYNGGSYQYTEAQMRRRIMRLRWKLWRAGGVDIVVTHAPPYGVGDGTDYAHRGFVCLKELLDKYKPAYLLHGHMHLSYGADRTRVREYGRTQVINTTGRYEFDVATGENHKHKKNTLVWLTRPKDPYPEDPLAYRVNKPHKF